MNINSVKNISGISYNKINFAKKDNQPNQTSKITNSINLNNLPYGIINRSLVSFRGNCDKKYGNLFLNYSDVYNSKTKILPKECYTGFADKEIYYSGSSASAPLSQDNAWKLFAPDEFDNFLEENPNLSDILYESPLGKDYINYGLKFDLQCIRNILKNTDKNDRIKPVFDFAEALDEKFGIDVLKEPKYYRSVGISELIPLLKGEKIKNQRYFQSGLDITINPELNWNPFRITFKTNDKFTNEEENKSVNNKVREHDLNEYYYYLEDTYSIDDVEKLEMATPHGLLEFDLNHKYTNEELEAINTLMFCE